MAPTRTPNEQWYEDAHTAWVKVNSWGLTRNQFISLSYFHGCIENGSDGKGPVNGSEDRPGDVVYQSENGSSMTRAMVESWLTKYSAFEHGYVVARREMAEQIKV